MRVSIQRVKVSVSDKSKSATFTLQVSEFDNGKEEEVIQHLEALAPLILGTSLADAEEVSQLRDRVRALEAKLRDERSRVKMLEPEALLLRRRLERVESPNE